MKIVGVAFGDPLDPRTFSGYSRHLFTAIEAHGALGGTLSARRLRFADMFDGALQFSRGRRGVWRPRLNGRWLWRPDTIDKLSRRLESRLSREGVSGPVLQVGTTVYPVNPTRVFCCVTDMTVRVAAEAARFRMESLSPRQRTEADECQRRIFDSSTLIFVLSEWIKQSVVEHYGQSDDKVIAIGAGANIEPLAPAPNKYASGEILFVAFDWESKGGPLLLEAFQRLRRTTPHARLTVIGCSPKIQSDGVDVVGPLDRRVPEQHARLKSAYQNAACFCLLSEFDAFPNVLLEAQYTGTPVVALDRGSRREGLIDGQTGHLVQNADPDEVAEALRRIVACPDTARTFGERGRAFVAGRFTWPVVAGRVIAEIDRAVTS